MNGTPRPPASAEDDRLIPLARVREIVSLSKAMIYRLIQRGAFPRPCKVGGVASRWSEREIRDWRDHRLASRAE